MLPSNLPATLRSYGLKVEETPGWRHRGRPGSFAPVGVLCHHTATGPGVSDATTAKLLTDGRSDLRGPLCQIGLKRDGTVVLVAAGRANHAGKAKSSGTVAAGDGNTLYIGIEAYNDGVGEPWPPAQYAAYVVLAAALCKEVTGNSVNTVRGHKETSVTGKIDPTFDMDEFRRDVAVQMSQRPSAAKPKPKPHVVSNHVTRGRAHMADAIHALVAAQGDLTKAKGRTAVRAILIAANSTAAAILRAALKRGPKK